MHIIKPKRSSCFLKGLFLSVIFCTIVPGESPVRHQPSTGTGTFSLSSAIQYAMSHHPVFTALKIEEEKTYLNLKEVHFQSLLPEFRLSGEAGAVPEARGNIFDSPDKQSDLDGWGPFFKLNITLAQPIFTFGRKSSSSALARTGIELQKIKYHTEVDKSVLKIIQAYWGLFAAQQQARMAREIDENFQKLLREVKERLDSEDSQVDDADYLEIKSNQYHIQEIYLKSETERNLAQKFFNAAIGRPLTDPVSISEQTQPEINLDKDQIPELIKKVLPLHRDNRSLETTLNLLKNQEALAKNQRHPLIYLAGGLGYAYAPHRQDQTNPFAVDNFNYLNLGIFLGLQWDLNHFRKNYPAERYQLDIQALQYQKQLLHMKLELEIQKTFAEVTTNQNLLVQAQESLKAAKTWMQLGMDNWDMGLGEVERLIRAYNTYYQMKGVVIKRTLDLNTSLAYFAFVLGDARLYLEWIKNARVTIL